jgi:hypothetical protein
MADLSRNIGAEYDVSIFDESRREILERLVTENPPSDGLARYIAHETAKLNARGVSKEERDARRADLVCLGITNADFAKWLRANLSPRD